jgi:hypothetical protein
MKRASRVSPPERFDAAKVTAPHGDKLDAALR